MLEAITPSHVEHSIRPSHLVIDVFTTREKIKRQTVRSLIHAVEPQVNSSDLQATVQKRRHHMPTDVSPSTSHKNRLSHGQDRIRGGGAVWGGVA